MSTFVLEELGTVKKVFLIVGLLGIISNVALLFGFGLLLVGLGESFLFPRPGSLLFNICLYGMISSSLFVIAGVFLKPKREWAYKVSIAACILWLINLPVGTIVSVWGLIKLRNKAIKDFYFEG